MQTLLTHSPYIFGNAARELRYRYAGSIAGAAWYLLHPLGLILIYTLVFSKLMRVRVPNLDNAQGFAIYLCSGLLPWIGFSEGLLRAADSFIINSSYLKKLPIPEEVFVAKETVTALFNQILSLSLLLPLCLLLGHHPSPAWLLLPGVLLLFSLFGFGLGLMLAALTPFFRDLSQGLAIFLQLWFWGSPIVYTEDILPPAAARLLDLNPASWYIRAFHEIIVGRQAPNLQTWLIMISTAAFSLLLGTLVLKRLKGEIRDLL